MFQPETVFRTLNPFPFSRFFFTIAAPGMPRPIFIDICHEPKEFFFTGRLQCDGMTIRDQAVDFM